MSSLGVRIRETREKKGLSQAAIAEELNVSQQAIQQVESGKARKPRYLYELSNLLDVSYEWLLHGKEALSYQQNQPYEAGSVMQPQSLSASEQIKILELTMGGENGCYTLTGNMADMTYRPRYLDQVSKAYGVYVYDNRMSPRYNPGEVVFTHPGRPVANGDYVVAHIRQQVDPQKVDILIAQMRQRGMNTLVFNLINTEEILRVEAIRVIAADKIVGSAE